MPIADRVPAWAGPVGLLVLALLVGAFLAIAEPATGLLPRCPSRTLLGVFCPGCGSQRTIHALMNGHPFLAMRVNPFVVVALPYLAYSWLHWFCASIGRPMPQRFIPSKAIWTFLAVLLILTTIRNVPSWNNALGLADLDNYAAGSR